MSVNRIKEHLENYDILEMRHMVCQEVGDVCSQVAIKEAREFTALKTAITMLPKEEREVVEKIYIGHQSISRFAKERGYSRRNVYYILDRIYEKLSKVLEVVENLSH